MLKTSIISKKANKPLRTWEAFEQRKAAAEIETRLLDEKQFAK